MPTGRHSGGFRPAEEKYNEKTGEGKKKRKDCLNLDLLDYEINLIFRTAPDGRENGNRVNLSIMRITVQTMGGAVECPIANRQ